MVTKHLLSQIIGRSICASVVPLAKNCSAICRWHMTVVWKCTGLRWIKPPNCSNKSGIGQIKWWIQRNLGPDVHDKSSIFGRKFPLFSSFSNFRGMTRRNVKLPFFRQRSPPSSLKFRVLHDNAPDNNSPWNAVRTSSYSKILYVSVYLYMYIYIYIDICIHACMHGKSMQI